MKNLFATASALALAAGLFAPAPASATLYDWTLTRTDTGSGTLTTGAADGGGFDITAFTGTIDGVAITGLIGGNPGPSGNFSYSGGLFIAYATSFTPMTTGQAATAG